AAARAMIEHEGPVYYRCGYKNEKDVHEGPVDFEIGKSIKISDGRDAAVFFAGPIGYDVKLACEKLKSEDGINVRLVSMHSIKPIDWEEIVYCAKTIGRIVTVEEHNLSGGLGSAVAEVLADEGAICHFKRIALPDVYVSKVGSQAWLRGQYGLGVEDVYHEIKKTAMA
ncbi:MAG: hypothetical protein IJV00_00225, partial [Clostridia bacterium]|nr:hypothetical protein [Clostridia bacterium]